jgi:hypothetical protein
MSAARARQVGVDPNDFPSSSVEDLQPRYAPPLPSAAGSRARRTHTPESGPDGTPDRPNAGDVLQPDPLARIETDRDRGAYPGPSGNSNVLLPDR